jgi:hypothetical protein
MVSVLRTADVADGAQAANPFAMITLLADLRTASPLPDSIPTDIQSHVLSAQSSLQSVASKLTATKNAAAANYNAPGHVNKGVLAVSGVAAVAVFLGAVML